MNPIIDFINANRDRYLAELKTYLAIPSISALPEHAGDVRRCAEWTADELTRIGLQNVRLDETPGHPIVYGEWLGAPGAPTMLFYGHYDVQPVDPVDLWESPPFEATVRDGEIYARGSADDKGQIFMHFKAIEAHLKQAGKLPINVKVVLEGEEEVGSAQPRRLHHARTRRSSPPTSSSSPTRRCSIAASRRSATACAAWPTSRSTCAARRPTCTRDRSAAPSPTPPSCWRRSWRGPRTRAARIKIPGFYDKVRELAPEERAEFAKLPFKEKQVPQGSRRAEAVRRERLHDARARVGPADVRGQRPARRLHRRGREDGDSGRRDGQGQHAAGAGSGSGRDRRS